MQFRPQRGTLSDSLSELRHVSATREALALEASLQLGRVVELGDVEVRPYCYDHRIRWDTHIVSVGGVPIGFTDGPIS